MHFAVITASFPCLIGKRGLEEFILKSVWFERSVTVPVMSKNGRAENLICLFAFRFLNA